MWRITHRQIKMKTVYILGLVVIVLVSIALSDYGQWTNPITSLDSSGDLILFFHNETSPDIANSKDLTLNINSSHPESDITQAVTFSGQEIGNFTTVAGIPSLSFLRSGLINIHIHAEKTAGTKGVRLQLLIYILNSSSEYTLFSTSNPSSLIIAGENEYDFHSILNDTFLDLSDRIHIQVIAILEGVGSNPTVKFIFDGETATRIELPAPSVSINNFIPYQGATQDVDLNNRSITLNNLTANNLSGTLDCSNVTGATSDLCTITSGGSGSSPIYVVCGGITDYFEEEGEGEESNETFVREPISLYTLDTDNISGTTAIDYYQNQNGTCSMDAGCDTVGGKVKQCSDFDGSNDFIDLGNHEMAGSEQDFAVSFWINIPEQSGATDYIFKQGEESSARWIGCYVDKVNILINCIGDDGSSAKIVGDGGSKYSYNIWNFIVFQRVGTNLYLYINDTLYDTQAANSASYYENSHMDLGRRSSVGDRYIDGLIDEFSLWDESLNDSERTYLYNLTYGRSPPYIETSEGGESTIQNNLINWTCGHSLNTNLSYYLWDDVNVTGLAMECNSTVGDITVALDTISDGYSGCNVTVFDGAIRNFTTCSNEIDSGNWTYLRTYNNTGRENCVVTTRFITR